MPAFGAMQRGDLLDVTPEILGPLLRTSTLRGAFFLTQAVARRMVARRRRRRGTARIVFVSSANAFMAAPERGEYCVSKTGVSMMARLFALRLAEDGIARATTSAPASSAPT